MRVVREWRWLSKTQQDRVRILDRLYRRLPADYVYDKNYVFFVSGSRLYGFARFKTLHVVPLFFSESTRMVRVGKLDYFTAPRHGHTCLTSLLRFLDKHYVQLHLFIDRDPHTAYRARKYLFKHHGFSTEEKAPHGTFMLRTQSSK